MEVALRPEGAWAAGPILWVLGYQIALGCARSGLGTALMALYWTLLVLATTRNPSRLLLRALVVLPFCLSALPMAFSGPGPEVPLAWGWSAHLPGALRWGQLMVRAWLGLAATLWLLDWLGRDALLRGLASLGCPRLILAVVSLALRYLEVLTQELGRMQTARLARGSGEMAPSWSWRARSAGELAGALMLRSQHRAQRVSYAMVSRGGLLPPSRSRRPGGATLARWLLGYAVLAGLCRWL